MSVSEIRKKKLENKGLKIFYLACFIFSNLNLRYRKW